MVEHSWPPEPLNVPSTPPTTSAGFGRARDWIARRTDDDRDGVLVAAGSTGSYGAGLTESLAEVGYRVVGAPTPRRERGRGKTDAMEAVTAASNTLAIPALPRILIR